MAEKINGAKAAFAKYAYLAASLLWALYVLGQERGPNSDFYNKLSYFLFLLAPLNRLSTNVPSATKSYYGIVSFSSELNKIKGNKPQSIVVDEHLERIIANAKSLKISLVINKLCYSVKGKVLFDNFSLVINAGEKILITGDNATGKSTLINLITGIARPNSGKIYLKIEGSRDGQCEIDCNSNNSDYVRKLISTVLQTSRIIDVLDALNNKTSASGENVYSGGESQFQAITRTSVSYFPIILFDETTSALDKKNKSKFRKHLDTLDKQTVLFATHDQDEIESFLNRRTYKHIILQGKGKVKVNEKRHVRNLKPS